MEDAAAGVRRGACRDRPGRPDALRDGSPEAGRAEWDRGRSVVPAPERLRASAFRDAEKALLPARASAGGVVQALPRDRGGAALQDVRRVVLPGDGQPAGRARPEQKRLEPQVSQAAAAEVERGVAGPRDEEPARRGALLRSERRGTAGVVPKESGPGEARSGAAW